MRFNNIRNAVSCIRAINANINTENLMIVDLERNDLGRISRPGSVKVDELFTVEKYQTLYQMTSTVTAEPKRGVI